MGIDLTYRRMHAVRKYQIASRLHGLKNPHGFKSRAKFLIDTLSNMVATHEVRVLIGKRAYPADRLRIIRALKNGITAQLESVRFANLLHKKWKDRLRNNPDKPWLIISLKQLRAFENRADRAKQKAAA